MIGYSAVPVGRVWTLYPTGEDHIPWCDGTETTMLRTRRSERKRMSVVAGVDESPVSRLVVTRALEQARWRDTHLHVVHVFYQPMVYTEAVIDWGEVAAAQRAAVWDSVDDLLAESDVGLERVDLEGYPPDALVAYASDIHASLVVVGTRGRGELAALVLGSTSHRAIHHADCDVLVVKDSHSKR